MNLATLGLAIDSTGAAAGARAFKASTDDVVASAGRATAATDRMAGGFTGVTTAARSTAAAVAQARAQTERAIDNLAGGLDAKLRTLESKVRAGLLKPKEAEEAAKANAAAYNRALEAELKRTASATGFGMRGGTDFAEMMRRSLIAPGESLLNPAAMKPLEENARKGKLALGNLSESMRSLVTQSLGTNSVVAQLGGTLGNLALGSAATIGVLAGLAAIGYAYNRLTDDARKTAEQARKTIDELQRLRDAERTPGQVAAGQVDVLRANRDRLARLVADPRAVDTANLFTAPGQLVKDLAKANADLAESYRLVDRARAETTQRINSATAATTGLLATGRALDPQNVALAASARQQAESYRALAAQTTDLAEKNRLLGLANDLTAPERTAQDRAKAEAKSAADALKTRSDAQIKASREYAATQRIALADQLRLSEAATQGGAVVEYVTAQLAREREIREALRVSIGADTAATIANVNARYDLLAVDRDLVRLRTSAEAGRAGIGATMAQNAQNAVSRKIAGDAQSRRIEDYMREVLDGGPSMSAQISENLQRGVQSGIARGIEGALTDGLGSFREFAGNVAGIFRSVLAESLSASAMAAFQKLGGAQQRQLQGALGGAVVGYGVGGAFTNRGVGAFAGAASGAAAGSAFGPGGTIAGGITGFLGGLLGASNSAQQAARQMAEAERAWKAALTGFTEIARGTSNALLDALRQNEAQRDALLSQSGALAVSSTGDVMRRRREEQARNAEIERIAAENRERIIREQAERDRVAEQQRAADEARRAAEIARERQRRDGELAEREAALRGDVRGGVYAGAQSRATAQGNEATDAFNAGRITEAELVRWLAVINGEWQKTLADYEESVRSAAQATAEATAQREREMVAMAAREAESDDVRGLRALGATREADALARQYAREEEIRALRERGASEAIVSARQYTQALERQAEAAAAAAAAVEQSIAAQQRLVDITLSTNDRYLRATGQGAAADAQKIGLQYAKDYVELLNAGAGSEAFRQLDFLRDFDLAALTTAASQTATAVAAATRASANSGVTGASYFKGATEAQLDRYGDIAARHYEVTRRHTSLLERIADNTGNPLAAFVGGMGGALTVRVEIADVSPGGSRVDAAGARIIADAVARVLRPGDNLMVTIDRNLDTTQQTAQLRRGMSQVS